MPLKRLVKMTFRKEAVDAFLQVFNESKELIRNFEGCKHLELWQDQSNPQVFFTFSIWSSELHLEQYRQSQLFRTTWQQTKILFDAGPQAWSVQDLVVLA